MSSVLGKNLKVSVFGQSHSAAIGCCIDGLPAGEVIDRAELLEFMKRRAPGRHSYSTARTEDDLPEFLAGVLENEAGGLVTCGTPVMIVIRNKDCRPSDYMTFNDIPRPGHADYAAHMKYKGYQDVRGGGHFSGRLTAPLCAAGGICRQLLERRGILVRAHIYSIGDIFDEPFHPVRIGTGGQETAVNGDFPVIDADKGSLMIKAIETCRQAGDSIGGIVECAVTGLPAGLGDPMFEGLENLIAGAVFGIPAVKGIEFGAGFAASRMKGSEHNDPFRMKDGKVATVTNNHGGILGGLSSGMPLLFRVAFKPTPSICQPQESVSYTGRCNTELSVTGRHDPCIVPRAVPVVEAVAAIVLLDLLN